MYQLPKLFILSVRAWVLLVGAYSLWVFLKVALISKKLFDLTWQKNQYLFCLNYYLSSLAITVACTACKVSKYGVFLVRIFPPSDLSLHIKSECGNIRTKKTPYLDTFHEVLNFNPDNHCVMVLSVFISLKWEWILSTWNALSNYILPTDYSFTHAQDRPVLLGRWT